jgi:transposase-like protein
MSKKRNRYSPEVKDKMALASLKNEETVCGPAARFGGKEDIRVERS